MDEEDIVASALQNTLSAASLQQQQPEIPKNCPAYITLSNINDIFFVHIKQFIPSSHGGGAYFCNTDGITLSMCDFSSCMLQMRAIEKSLLEISQDNNSKMLANNNNDDTFSINNLFFEPSSPPSTALQPTVNSGKRKSDDGCGSSSSKSKKSKKSAQVI